MPDSTIVLKTRADLTALIAARNSFNVLSKEEQAAERAALSLAQSMARLDAKMGDSVGAANRLKAALQNAAFIDDKQAVGALNQIISLEQRAAAEAARLGKAGGIQILPRTVESFGTQALDQLKGGLLNIVGPAALAAGAIGTVKGVVDSFVEAFKFKAELDQNTASITAQLRGVRDSSQAFAEARVFAERYKLTQEETTTAIQASVPLLRQSKSSLTDVLTVLAKLQVLKPEQGIQGAAFALAELQGGQSRSLATRFNIPIAKANELKEEIRGGADAVQVLGDYLTNAGIGAEALEVGTKGAAGALRDVARAQEELKIAQADFAQGPGILILAEQTRLTTGLSRVLGGSGGLSAAFTAIGQRAQESNTYQLVYNQSIESGATAAEADAAALAALAQVQQAQADAVKYGASAYDANVAAVTAHTDALGINSNALSKDAQEKLASKIETAALAEQQAQLDADSRLAAQGLLGAGDQALLLAQKYGIAADQAQFLIQQQQRLSNATALADQRVGERDPSNTQTAAEFDKFSKLRRAGAAEEAAERKKAADVAKRAADKAAADAQRLHDLQNQNRIINAKTSAEKIAILERQKAAETDAIKRQEIQNQIDQERNSKPKGGAAGKGLGALDRVDISLAGDYQAQLDAVNAKLAKGHLTELQTKQLKKEQLDLQKKIADEQDRAHKAALDARISEIEDRKQRREEAKRLSAANAVLAHPELFNEEQRANAADLVELIPLQQQKRTDEIDAKRREAGSNVALTPAPSNAPPPGAAQQPTGAPQAPTPVGTGGTPLILQMDSKQVGTILLPVIIDGLRASAFQVRAAGG